MYGKIQAKKDNNTVAGPCEFLVMYGYPISIIPIPTVAGPCEFLVMYGRST